MATITATVITTEELETPVYRKIVDPPTFFKIYSATEMLVVLGTRSLNVMSYPGGQIESVDDTEESDETEFTTAYDAAKTFMDAL